MSLALSDVSDSVDATGDESAIPRLADWAEAWAVAQNLGGDIAFAMRLCVEEAVTNIVLYAYDPSSTDRPIHVQAERAGGAVQVVITDAGRPFDVAAAPDPGPERDIMSAQNGGRGIRLMRSFASRIDYARMTDQNRLTLTFLTDTPKPGR